MKKMLFLLVVALLPRGLATAASFTGLGDLPGGGFVSRVYGVSGDGSVVVGESDVAINFEAFRWDSTGGMVGGLPLFLVPVVMRVYHTYDSRGMFQSAGRC